MATIEILVAVTIVLVVGTLGILSFGNNDRGVIRAEAAETALFLQQARMRALELGRPIEIILSAPDHILDAGGYQHLFPTNIDISPEQARIVLQPAGGSDGLTITLSKDDNQTDVQLNWLTGRVSIQ